jgi:FkbM family methyltransferase
MSTPPADASMTIERNGTRREFIYPAGTTEALVKEIFLGREYRLVGGYHPDVIVDIGANIGAVGVFFHLNYPKARLICFEPSPLSFSYLQRNLGNLPHVELHPVGLSDRAAQQAQLFTGTKNCMQSTLMQSMEAGEEFESIELRRASEEFDRLELKHISILKVDTEGCELPILRDLGSRLEQVDLLYVEYHSDDDRRAIDALLAPDFLLHFAHGMHIHRGSALYISRRITGRLDAAAFSITPR